MNFCAVTHTLFIDLVCDQMSDIRILLSRFTSEIEHRCAATRIIATYDLPLTCDQILKTFQDMREYIMSGANQVYYINRSFLMAELLSININMFIAVILACNDKFTQDSIPYLINYKVYEDIRNVGVMNRNSDESYNKYCILLDYYDFDVSNLNMNEAERSRIQRYRDERYGGRLVKGAVKK